MYLLKRPSDEFVRDHLKSLQEEPFSFPTGHIKNRTVPVGFQHDVATFPLGKGDTVWRHAIEAIQDWRMFPSSMVTLVRLTDEQAVGSVVAVVCKALGLWTINPARVFDVHQEEHRIGFTYGAIPGHIAQGEELFCIERNAATGEVTYRVEAISRPKHLLIWFGYPYARWMQARFRRLSGASMQAYVHERDNS